MELLGAMSWNSLNGIFTSENHDLHGLEFQANPNNHNHLNYATLSPSFDLPFSNYCNSYEVDESCYSYGAYSDDHHHPVACCDTSYSSLALYCEQEISMRSNPDFYLQCLNQDMVITDQDASEMPSKKRPRSTPTNSIDHDDQGGAKRKRNLKPRKDKTLQEDNLKWPISPNSSSSSKDKNSNSIHEELGGIASSSSPKGSAPPASLNLDGKARASRGSASDPQSVYARKRREKINERLRTLQTIVPNGTKVDISTMLEDAVQYVKFLQLQIKLLSSDDLWMYAPLAYNGMNI